MLEGLMLNLKLQNFGQVMWRIDSLEKTLMLGKMQEEKGPTEDEMVRWHHPFDGHEFEQTLGVGKGQGSLMCCSPWDCKEPDVTKHAHTQEEDWVWREKKQVRLAPQVEVNRSCSSCTWTYKWVLEVLMGDPFQWGHGWSWEWDWMPHKTLVL